MRIFILLILMMMTNPLFGQEIKNWDIVIDKSLLDDEAIKVALSDLEKAGKELGITFKTHSDKKNLKQNSILVGSPPRNIMTAELVKSSKIQLQRVDDPQGYEIMTTELNGHKIMFVSGGSILGEVYGLYWIWDRMRVFKELPAINVIRIPALKTRVSLSWGRRGSGGESKADMQRALRYSINWVSGPPILDLVPWNSEPERTNNEKNRERVKKLIEYAHALHLKYYSFANELTFHPSILSEFGSSLSPCDPRFWEAVQAKYRRLFQALPELDGIELCNDDISGFWDNYQGFDLMHEGENCEWPYNKRFRTYVKKVYDVVVNEFDKTYFHFTWSLVAYEQHSQADVFKKIFTDEIPVKNLYLIPKITAADRWWHQPYNPTFNQTPHHTIVGFETMNYYESSNSHIFPTFSGQYFQAGLQTILRSKTNNVKGAGYLVGSSEDGWDTRSAYSYVLFRLSWNPDEDIKQIAEDFCAIHFGRAAAEKMAEIYLLSPVAYKYGLHIEPVSYGQFNSLLQIRVGTFPVQGYPSIDNGKEHIDFLHTIYLRCKPWKFETVDDLDHGLATANTMVQKFSSVKPLIADVELAQTVENSLNMTRLLIETNNLYVKTAFAYFEYRENPTEERKNTLADFYNRLLQIRESFMNAPGFGYQLFGIDQLLKNVNQALTDLKSAEQALNEAPTQEELESTIAQQQQLYKQLLQKYENEAVKFLHFEAAIDGRDILIIQGSDYKIEHLRWDAPVIKECQFLNSLPPKVVTVIPDNIQSRPIHPFVLQQPNEENNFTAKIYLYDKPGGYGVMSFDLYYIQKPSAQLGLKNSW